MLILIVVALLMHQVVGSVRVPAEWEPIEAIWLQWPFGFERSYRPAFVEIVAALTQREQKVHMLVKNRFLKHNAKRMLQKGKANLDFLEFHNVKYDNAWLRDNGPMFLFDENASLVLQDFGFNAWSQKDLYYKRDNRVPSQIGSILKLPVQNRNSFILERGTFEFNGKGALITSWPCLSKRNPDWQREEMEELFIEAWGVSQIVWVEKAPPSDTVTSGHIDGIARFVNEHTVIVADVYDLEDPDKQAFDDAAAIIQNAGFQVFRIKTSDYFKYKNEWMNGGYVNYLFVNGILLMPAFDMPQDDIAKTVLASLYPDAEIVKIDSRVLWYNGGAVHCVTNDQPSF